jgi:hypothetical protein
MSKKHSWGLALLACALAVGWLVGTAVSANAAPATLGAWNLELIGAVDVAVGGSPDQSRDYSKISPWPDTDDTYLYVGCYESSIDPEYPGCFRVVDVKHPKNPKRIATVEVFDRVKSPLPPVPGDPYWTTHSATNVWTNDAFNNLPFSTSCGDWAVAADGTRTGPGWTTGPTCWDKGWITRTHYTAFASGEYSEPDSGPGCGLQQDKKILWVNSQRQGGAPAKRLGYTGVGFYDMKDPANPKFLSRIDFPVGRLANGTYTEAGGVHHGFFDGRYAYLGAEWEGFFGKILVIVDAKDPKKPVVVGRWWIPGQNSLDPAENPPVRYWVQQGSFSSPIKVNGSNTLPSRHVGMHYISVNHIHGKEIAFLSYHQAGLVILDVTDKSNPKFISMLDFLSPEFQALEPQSGTPSPDHAKCVEVNGAGSACGNAHSAKLVPDTHILWMTDEYFNPPYGHLRLIDVSNLKKPKIISHYLFPENLNGLPAEYPSRGPSSHLGNAYNKNLLFLGWYGLGVRVFDISNPKDPKQVAFYSYEIDDGVGGQGTYDVIFDPKGNLVVTDEGDGVRVLKYTGPGAPLK